MLYMFTFTSLVFKELLLSGGNVITSLFLGSIGSSATLVNCLVFVDQAPL